MTEIATIVERGKFNPANFFSFFTIESNLFAVVILVLSALVISKGRSSKRLNMLRGASALNMLVVGIVFALLLSGLDAELTAVPWDNTVLHSIMPVIVGLDWFIERPKVRIAFRHALVWTIFPFAYVLYSLIRGSFVNWYPYPFLDPAKRGYVGILITSVCIALLAAGLIWILTRYTGRGNTNAKAN